MRHSTFRLSSVPCYWTATGLLDVFDVFYTLEIMVASVYISKERQLITYSNFWNASRFLLESGKRDERGSYYQFLASLVFSAFTFEAFLNHIGEHLFSRWPELERRLSTPREACAHW